MPRYLVERTFPDGLALPADPTDLCATLEGLVASNADQDVNWVRSFVAHDHSKTFCIYDAASPEAIRQAAASSSLPVDTITAVGVLDPYLYVGRRS